MSNPTTTDWITGWTADDPLAIGSSRVDVDQGSWEAGPVPYLEYRNLELDAASGGQMTCRHIRAARRPAGEEESWQAHDVDFQFIYVLKGSLTLAWEHGG